LNTVTTNVEAFVYHLSIFYSILLLQCCNIFRKQLHPMEPWSDLLSNLEFDETENIFLATCDQRLSHPSTANPPSELPRHDSGVSGVSTKEEEDNTKLLHHSNETFRAPAHSAANCKKEQPTQDDFNNAVWISTKRNGITRYWAPHYTASLHHHHSTTENARTLHMFSVRSAAAAPNGPKTYTAVDLAPGSGSFAFNHAAAGAQKVLCWDANPWSIEGLRRGAIRNGWHVRVHSGDHFPNKNVKVHSRTRVVAFIEHGDKALARIQSLRDSLPPVRYVNCGSLPTSRSSRETAAAILDPRLGGWIHVQESYRVEEVVCEANRTRAEFETMVEGLDRDRGCLTNVKGAKRKPVVQHIQRGESNVPGVFHCILDIHIPPLPI
jgi:tRNA wybutosine-synthesizing protein 2